MNVGKVLAADSTKLGNAYYDETTRHMNLDDLLFNNRFRQSFSSLSFGASNAFQIPNSAFVSDCFISMRFPGVASVGPNVMNLVPVPAYTVIERIEIKIAGSTVYTQNGINMLHDILFNCDSKSKRDEIIRLAGGSGTNGFTADSTYYAYLNVPWANIAARIKKLPLDTMLFKQPISITVFTKPGSSVYYQSGGAGLVIPASFVEGELVVRQGELKNPSSRLILGTEIVQNGVVQTLSDNYAYPFTYSQGNITQTFTGSVVGNQPAQVSLSGFQKGHLQAIRFMLYNQTTSTISYPSTAATNMLATEEPLSFELLFNGQTIFRSKYDSWKMSNLIENSSSCDFSTTPSGTSYYSITVNMVDFLEKIAGEQFQDGINLSSQTLVASLNTPTANNYVLICTYLYHAHVVCNGNTAEFVYE